VTIAAWIIVGLIVGVLARVVMPVPRDGGNLTAAIVGVCSACVGGGLAAMFFDGGLIQFNPYSVGWAAAAAMYSVFAYRCLAVRGN
jgi:uncharacterized membrane protein YeaQ/YmgE (transglycosylase-associated protein family)